MALQPLAAVDDALGYGFDTVDETHLMRASQLIRTELMPRGVVVTVATPTTTVGRGPLITLSGRVLSVTSVTDEDGTALTVDDWELAPGGLVQVLTSTNATGLWTIVYSKGAISDEAVYLVCSIASRFAAASTGLAAGVQQEAGGGYQVTYGVAAWRAQSDLTDGERNQIRKLFPRVPKLIVMGA